MTERTSNALEILRTTFGYPAFRGSQQEIITHVAGGGDALVLMPTGKGFYYFYFLVALRSVDIAAEDFHFGQPTKRKVKTAIQLTSKFARTMRTCLDGTIKRLRLRGGNLS